MILPKVSKVRLGVIGSSSMVGSRFCELILSQFDLIEADLHGEIIVDLTKRETVKDFFEKQEFSWVILLSAFTDVDEAEKQRNDQNGNCWQINVEGTRNVLSFCQRYNRKLLFISTDFVFDGENGPYSEDDEPGGRMEKISWYGLSKLKAERVVKENLKDFVIMRISYPYRAKFAPKDDFAKTILRRYRMGTLFPMFADQKITPTFIDDLAAAVALIIRENRRGFFHLASPQVTNPYDFACELITVFGGDVEEVQKGSLVKSFNKKEVIAPRPVNGGLKVARISKAGLAPTGWRQGIRRIFDQSNGQLI